MDTSLFKFVLIEADDVDVCFLKKTFQQLLYFSSIVSRVECSCTS